MTSIRSKRTEKKMKKLLALIISVIAIFGLTSCGESDIPQGMQFVAGGETDGYYFYAPEGWVAFNNDGVAMAYVSTANTTSINFIEVKSDKINKPDDWACGEEGCKGATLSASKHYFLFHYFDDTDFPESMNLIGEGDMIFGNDDAGQSAERCRYYEFTYKHNDIKYTEDGKGTLENIVTRGFKQFYIVNGDSFYLMTYAGIYDVPTYLTTSNYDAYKESLDTVVANFRFVEKKAADSASEEEITEEFRSVTAKSVAGFEFFAHKDFTVDYASGIVSVSHKDGSNVNMTRATAVGAYSNVYFERRLEELAEMGATEVTVIAREKPDGTTTVEPMASKLGQLPEAGYNAEYNYAFDLEYTYVFEGVKYHVYQVMGVKANLIVADGYVFTYTATEENYAAHLETVIAMRDKVNFG